MPYSCKHGLGLGTVFKQAMLKAPKNLKNKFKFEAYTVVEAIEYFSLLAYHKVSAYLWQQRGKRVKSNLYVLSILLTLIGPKIPPSVTFTMVDYNMKA